MSTAIFHTPGATRFAACFRERRTARYRSWVSPHRDMVYCAECLLCGAWQAGYTTRQGAEFWVTAVHARYCHVINGCHCTEPHLTAQLAARLGVCGAYPRELASWLFALAGGVRRYLPPRRDLNGVPFGGPEFGSGGYRWTR